MARPPGWLACGLLYVAVCSCVHGAAAGALTAQATQGGSLQRHRFVLAIDAAATERVRVQLAAQGYDVVSATEPMDGCSFLAVAADAAAPAAAASGAGQATGTSRRRKLVEQALNADRARHQQSLAALAGVHSSEQDLHRHLHVRPASQRRRLRNADAAQGQQASTARQRRLTGHWHLGDAYKPGAYDTWGNEVADPRCAAQDVPLSEGAHAEVVPWGVRAIGADSRALQDEAPKGRAIVCIIDSGLWQGHPEYKDSSCPACARASGCAPDAKECSFGWSEDIVGHGTHVAGTIGAPRNGRGVVGVVQKGAELYVVRIWNDSGDVSQGQGPYATDLVLAYSNCLAHLRAQQAAEAAKGAAGQPVRMVINMSYGSAGPLTVERLWVERAAARGDVLFVASAGNNGSWEVAVAARGPQSDRPDKGQYLSYPASYPLPEMLSVANARCDNTIDFTSQKNALVSIAAPGMAILSSVPRQYQAIRAHVATSPPLPRAPRPQGGARGAGRWAWPGSGRAAKLPEGRPLGYSSEGYREPRAVQGTRLGRVGPLPLSLCNISSEVRGAAYEAQRVRPAPCAAKGRICLIQLPALIDPYTETCMAMLRCIDAGGKGLLLWRDDKLLSGMLVPDPGYEELDEVLLGTQINCGSRCDCWRELAAALRCSGDGGSGCADRAPPAAVVSAKQARAMLELQRTQGAGGVNATLETFTYPYRYYDGTSMAAPHVSGGAALLWRLHPGCSAAEVAAALRDSAAPLDGSVSRLAGGAGLMRVDRAHALLQQRGCGARSSQRDSARRG